MVSPSMPPTRFWPADVALRLGRVSGLLLALYALWHLTQVEHVREFQAGAPSGWLERGLAWAVAVSVESLGFGLLAGLLACPALALAGWVFPRAERNDARWGAWWLCAGGVALWVWRGTYFAGEWLPFLAPLELSLLNLLGALGASLPGCLVAALLARWGAPRRAAWVGALVAASGLSAAVLGLGHLTNAPGGPGSPGALLGAGAWLVAGLLCAALGSRLLPKAPHAAALQSSPQQLGHSSNSTGPAAAPRGPVRVWSLRLLDGTLLLCWFVALFAIWREAQRLPPTSSSTSAAQASAEQPHAGPDTPAPTHNLASPAQPNVVYIVVDTLRADALSCYGYPRPTSPRLDQLASEGALFEDLSASAAWTKPTTGTLLTGLYPSRHGALYHGSRLRLPSGERTLAEAFREAGWHTAAFVTNPNIQAVFDFNRGFEQYSDAPVVDTLPKAALRAAWFGRLLIAVTRYQFNWNYANDNAEVNQSVLPWLEAHQDQRFFLYLHYIDPHSPYAPPASYRRRFSQSHGLVLHNRRKELVGRDLYDGEVAYQDHGLGQVFDALERLNLDQKTLVVISADHGEEWFEFGSLGHGQSLSQPLVHVPLILRGPGVPRGVRVPTPVETIGLPATLLELCGLLEPGGRFGDGRSFRALMEQPDNSSRPLFLENEFSMEHELKDDFVLSGVRQGSLKLVLTQKSIYRSEAGDILPTMELFDLAEDPGERRDLFDEPKLRAARESLVTALETHAQFLAAFGLRDAAPVILTDDQRRQLEALGYMVGH